LPYGLPQRLQPPGRPGKNSGAEGQKQGQAKRIYQIDLFCGKVIRVLKMSQKPVAGVKVHMDEKRHGIDEKTNEPAPLQCTGKGLGYRGAKQDSTQISGTEKETPEDIKSGAFLSEPVVKKFANSHKPPPTDK
jgi:hypothetical protein